MYTLLDACKKHGMKPTRLTKLAVMLVDNAWNTQVSITDNEDGTTTIIGRCSLNHKHDHLIWSKIYLDSVDSRQTPCGVLLVEELKRRLLDRGWYRNGLKRAISLGYIANSGGEIMQKMRENAYDQLQELTMIYRQQARQAQTPYAKQVWKDLERQTRKRRLKVVHQMIRKDV